MTGDVQVFSFRVLIWPQAIATDIYSIHLYLQVF